MKRVLISLLFLLVNSNISYSAETRFSGDPLPRFASITREKADARFGPSVKYPIKYTYKSKFQPVKVVNEYYGWYQIQDRYGDLSWVYKTALSKKNYAITIHDNIKLYARSKLTAEILAKVNKDVLFFVDECDNGFCRVETNFNNQHFKGFIIQDNLWGV